MARQSIQPAGLFDSAPWGFSQAVISDPGRVVSIAGQVAWNANQQVTAMDLAAQLRRALAHVLTAVEAAGGTQDDIQMLRLYIPRLVPGEDAKTIANVLHQTFGSQNLPASSWIGVHSLAQPEYLVEVEAMAVIPIHAPHRSHTTRGLNRE